MPASEVRARHAGEIEYVFDTLQSAQPSLPWTADDYHPTADQTRGRYEFLCVQAAPKPCASGGDR